MPRLFRVIPRSVFALVFGGLLWAGDPLIGTWKLNVSESKYGTVAPPKNQTRKYEPQADGLMVTVVTIPRSGPATTFQYLANPDGEEHSVAGNPDVDSLTLKRVDMLTAEGTLLFHGKVRGTILRVLSPDGQMMTIAYQYTDYKGKVFQQTTVFNKEKQ